MYSNETSFIFSGAQMIMITAPISEIMDLKKQWFALLDQDPKILRTGSLLNLFLLQSNIKSNQ